MPSRMPNWKMRAKALADGMPMTRLCRMPSRGSTCMMRTSWSTSVDGHDAVGVEHDGEVVVLAPALAEIADVAGLEAEVVRAAAVGHRDACRARPSASAPKRASSAAAIVGSLVSLST